MILYDICMYIGSLYDRYKWKLLNLKLLQPFSNKKEKKCIDVDAFKGVIEHAEMYI